MVAKRDTTSAEVSRVGKKKASEASSPVRADSDRVFKASGFPCDRVMGESLANGPRLLTKRRT
eukprot:scaffold11187_cov30-Tisochrysis_lutea.AAC.4